MSKTIFKFQLREKDLQTVPMHRGADIRSAQCQGIAICLWAEVDSTAPMENRVFEIFGTGHAIPDGDRSFIGTVQQGWFVFHIYELHNTTSSKTTSQP